LKGTWQYDAKQKLVTLTLDQTQTDGSFFRMPIQVALYFPNNNKAVIKTVQLMEKTNVFTFTVDAEPGKLVLDPISWVLMESVVTKK
jgi:aminopeptidase N